MFRTSDDFILENTCPIAVTSRCCSMKYRFALVLLKRNRSRCLFIVLGNIKLNEIKYARKSIYHVFLVWMGKSIPRASCYALRMDFPIHTRNTWKILIILSKYNKLNNYDKLLQLLHFSIIQLTMSPVLCTHSCFIFRRSLSLSYNKM